MRPGTRTVTVAAGLMAAAVLVGCGPATAPPEALAPPETVAPPAVVAPPVVRTPPPLSPPVEVPMPEVPTVVGPYVPPTPDPRPTASATPTPTPMPTMTPTPSPTPEPLLALLPAADTLPALTWGDGDGERTAAWTTAAPPAPADAAAAITHVAAVAGAGGACAAAAAAVTEGALAAAVGSYAADPAPGAPFELVLVRYPSTDAASAALTALRSLGTACTGVTTDDGVLEAGTGAHGPTVVLRAADAMLVAEATAVEALLAVVLHEGAPPAAVATLLDAVR